MHGWKIYKMDETVDGESRVVPVDNCLLSAFSEIKLEALLGICRRISTIFIYLMHSWFISSPIYWRPTATKNGESSSGCK